MLTRKEAYAYIKANEGLAEHIKTFTCKNYTNCATELLNSIITQWADEKIKNKKVVEKAVKPIPAPQDITSIVIRLVDVLKQKKLIINAEYHYILGN